MFVSKAYPLRCQHVTVMMGMKMKERSSPSQCPSHPRLIRWLADQKYHALDWLDADMQLHLHCCALAHHGWFGTCRGNWKTSMPLKS